MLRCVGLAKPYIHTDKQCIHGIFSREVAIHTVNIYGPGQPWRCALPAEMRLAC